MLLSFAQFEREVPAERIRDKIAASKKKGIWMGGNVPLGYDAVDRSLVINEAEAETVRTLFRLYLDKGNVRAVKTEADGMGLKTKVRIGPHGRKSGGKLFCRGHLYRILGNPIYVGRITHKDRTYPGSHDPIIDEEIWQATQQQLADNANGQQKQTTAKSPSLLVGVLIDSDGNRFTPSHAIKAGRRYRYYVERSLITGGRSANAKVRRIPANEIEEVVRDGIADLLDTPSRLLEALGGRLTAFEADGAIRKARNLRERLLKAPPATWVDAIRPVLHRVVLDDGVV